MTQQTFTLTESEIQVIAEAASKSTLEEQHNAFSSRESFIRWLETWSLNFIANKVANWALSQLQRLWNTIFG